MGFAQVKLSRSDLAATRAVLIGIEDGFPKAFSRALNKSATGVKTDMVDLARSGYNYKAGAIKKRISIERATYTRLSAKTVSVGPGVHMTDIIGTRQTKTGLTVNVKKSTGPQTIKHGFLNFGQRSGKKIAFQREVEAGKRVGRYPIEAIFASHPEIIYNTRENWAVLNRRAGERLDKNLAHEVDVVLKGIA